MQSLGYAVNKEGVCCGVAKMAVQALFLDERKVFDDRIDYIIGHDNLSDQLDAFRKSIPNRKKPVVLTNEEQRFIDILAFFDGVQLYQQPGSFPELFESSLTQKDTNKISSITSSLKLDEQGNLNTFGSWPGIYDYDQLYDYLRVLTTSGADNKESFSLLLSNSRHMIALFYHRDLDEWFFIDANNHDCIIKRRLSASDFTDKIIKAFDEKDKTTFESTLCLPKGKVKAAENIHKSITESTHFLKTHTITPDNANAQTHQGLTLAHIAALTPNLEFLKSLQKNGAHFDLPDSTGYCAYARILTLGFYAATPILVEAKVDINKPIINNKTLLMIAAASGQTDLVNELFLFNNLDVNKRSADGETALEQAVLTRQVNVILLLLDVENIDLQSKTGKSLEIEIAKIGLANPKIMKQLSSKGIRFNLVDENGQGLWCNALITNNVEALKELHHLGIDFKKEKLSEYDLASVSMGLNQKGIVTVLHECGVDFTAENQDGDTPAMIAVYLNNIEMLNTLRELNIDIKPNSLLKFAKEEDDVTQETIQYLEALVSNSMNPDRFFAPDSRTKQKSTEPGKDEDLTASVP